MEDQEDIVQSQNRRWQLQFNVFSNGIEMHGDVTGELKSRFDITKLDISVISNFISLIWEEAVAGFYYRGCSNQEIMSRMILNSEFK